MRFPISHLAAAMQVHLSKPLADRVELAASLGLGHAADGELISETEAGHLVSLALADDPLKHGEAIDGLELSYVEVATVEGSVRLDPEDAFSHPTFGRWVSGSIGGALAAPIRAGSQFVQYGPGAPVFGVTELVEVDGEIRAATSSIHFSETGATVMSFYGDTTVVDGPTGVLRRVTGAGLVEVGGALRAMPPAPSSPRKPKPTSTADTRH